MINSKYIKEAEVRGALRQLARYMPTKKIALERARDWTKQGVRGGAMYHCACGCGSYSAKDVQVDHIIPVVPLNRPVGSWDEYITRLFCTPDNLQVLARKCHKEKTSLEASQRKISVNT